jgi:uncharacterized protein with gpF-like domain
MTPTELRLWTAILRRAAALTPDLASRLLAAFVVLRNAFTDAELARAVQLGVPEQIAALVVNDATVAAALQPMRDELRSGIIDAVRYYQKQLPKPPVGTIGISFDYLNPRVIDAIRSLETRVMTSLTEDVRAVVRSVIERGMLDKIGPKALAQELRSVIGLGPSQLEQVANFRAKLEAGKSVTSYTLRDKRFKPPTTPEQVDKQVAAYLKKRIAQNAETISRTASLDAMKLGQRLSWQDAIEQGFVDGARMRKRWSGVLDDRERPEHWAMEGQTVGFDERFSNGEMIPGDSTYGCRCLPMYFQSPAVGRSQTEVSRSLANIGL